MSENVQITLILCASLLCALWMLRSTLQTVARSDKNDFIFIMKFPFGSGIVLSRGNERSPDEIARVFGAAERPDADPPPASNEGKE